VTNGGSRGNMPLGHNIVSGTFQLQFSDSQPLSAYAFQGGITRRIYA
jgi:hypothetical protein